MMIENRGGFPMTDHQFRQLLEVLRGIDDSLGAIARALTSTGESDENVDIHDIIDRGRLFGKD
jgi:hypothetical protein